MRRRHMTWPALWLAAGYLLSTAPLAAAVERLMPQTKTVFALDFPCAQHACGCRTAEQCRTACCCELRQRPVEPAMTCHLHEPPAPVAVAPRTVRVLVLQALECRGGAPARYLTAAPSLDQHVAPAAPARHQPDHGGLLVTVVHGPPAAPHRPLPDKVPIALL